ncbi:RNA polymerase sigma factor [Sphingobacterium humi]|uniref:Sigma-70 family RNA polymerase sigma factor n=1 Tax=Sphingobacterium humi TaxID=1796905 RepID=A0A6N8L202_9SPHI|nr:sigma-70 family RNA polymerase sigma factor [Sphingobacterium humi]MVZ63124.1 sigma-70 family RNA polymerase sigma factor [Sphingobacterium humi]
MKVVVGKALNDEEQLLLQLRNGDYSAYHRFYAMYAPMIMSRLRRLVLNSDIAEELHQEIFFQIWNEKEKLPNHVSLKAILLHRAKLQAYKYYHRTSKDRQMRAQLIAAATELYDQLEEQINFKETNALLMEAIAKLPKQRRKVFIRIKLEGKSYEDTAKEFGVTPSTIKDHMTRAFKFLRAELADENPNLFFLLLVSTLFK